MGGGNLGKGWREQSFMVRRVNDHLLNYWIDIMKNFFVLEIEKGHNKNVTSLPSHSVMNKLMFLVITHGYSINNRMESSRKERTW